MQKDLTCSICLEPFDLAGKIPRFLKECGHTFCSECITHQLESSHNRIKCCSCRKVTLGHQVSDFIKNFELISLIDKFRKNSLQKCILHDKKLKFYCMLEKKVLCSKCVEGCFDSNHSICPGDKFIEIINSKIASLELDIEKEVDKVKEIEKVRFSQIYEIKAKFECIKRVVKREEERILSDINFFFDKFLPDNKYFSFLFHLSYVKWVENFKQVASEWKTKVNFLKGAEINLMNTSFPEIKAFQKEELEMTINSQFETFKNKLPELTDLEEREYRKKLAEFFGDLVLRNPFTWKNKLVEIISPN